MSDDFVTGGILPVDDTAPSDSDFDPDAVESDMFLDDGPDALLDVGDLSGLTDDDEDALPEEIV